MNKDINVEVGKTYYHTHYKCNATIVAKSRLIVIANLKGIGTFSIGTHQLSELN